MNDKIRIGDIVSVKVFKAFSGMDCYVVDGFLYDAEIGTEFVTVIKIYPIMKNGKFESTLYTRDELDVVAVKGEQHWETIVNLIEEKRFNANLPFLMQSEFFLDIINENKVDKMYSPYNTHNNSVMDLTDEVQYDKFKTVDECLDSINRLREVARYLKTDEFDDKITILFNRLKELTQ